MPSSCCAVVNCMNNAPKLRKWKRQYCLIHQAVVTTRNCTCPLPFVMYCFPREAESRARWAKLINRQDPTTGKPWEPTKDSRVCSKHFVHGKPSYQHPDPTENMILHRRPKLPRRAVKRVKTGIDKQNAETENREEVMSVDEAVYQPQQANTMPTSSCAVKGCINSSYRLRQWKRRVCPIHKSKFGQGLCDCPPPYRLRCFPIGTELRNVWVKAIDRVDVKTGKTWQPSRTYDRVCSLHFEEGLPYPTLDLGHSQFMTTRMRRSLTRKSWTRHNKVEDLQKDFKVEKTSCESAADPAVLPLGIQENIFINKYHSISHMLRNLSAQQPAGKMSADLGYNDAASMMTGVTEVSEETGGQSPATLPLLPVQEKVYMEDNHGRHVMRKLSQLWEHQRLCDALITNGTITVKTHKVVLMAACPALLSLNEDIKAETTPIITVVLPPDIGRDTIIAFLGYIYSGMLHLTVDILPQMIKLAKIMKENAVLGFCEDFQKSVVQIPIKQEPIDPDLGTLAENEVTQSPPQASTNTMTSTPASRLGQNETTTQHVQYDLNSPAPCKVESLSPLLECSSGVISWKTDIPYSSGNNSNMISLLKTGTCKGPSSLPDSSILSSRKADTQHQTNHGVLCNSDTHPTEASLSLPLAVNSHSTKTEPDTGLPPSRTINNNPSSPDRSILSSRKADTQHQTNHGALCNSVTHPTEASLSLPLAVNSHSTETEPDTGLPPSQTINNNPKPGRVLLVKSQSGSYKLLSLKSPGTPTSLATYSVLPLKKTNLPLPKSTGAQIQALTAPGGTTMPRVNSVPSSTQTVSNCSSAQPQIEKKPAKEVKILSKSLFFTPRHQREHDYKCKECSVPLFTDKHVTQHMQTFHQIDQKDAIDYVVAEAKGDPKIIACGICDYQPRARSHLPYHRYVKHQIPLPKVCKIWPCRVCSKDFLRRSSFREHLNTHKDHASYICDTCGLGFAKKHSLNMHVYNCHNDERRFVCKQCAKGFKNRLQIKIHLRSHTGVRPFKCPQCAYQGTTKGNLKVHMLKHHGESLDKADVPASEDVKLLENSVTPVEELFEVLPSSKDTV